MKLVLMCIVVLEYGSAEGPQRFVKIWITISPERLIAQEHLIKNGLEMEKKSRKLIFSGKLLEGA